MRRLIAMTVFLAALVLAGLALEVTGEAQPGGSRAGEHGLQHFPFMARGPGSAALGRGDAGFRVAELRARNRAQRVGTRFSRAGVTVASGSGRVRLRLARYGRAGASRRVRRVTPRVAANRVDYARGRVDEWYVNGPLGLEQGFDVASRPARGSGPLMLSLAASGSLRARAGRSGIVFAGRGETLRYGGLTASDARGRRLPASLRVRPGGLEILVDDRDAAFPVRVDPFIRQ